MNQPSVFISCVSPEFRQTRSRVAEILTRLGYTPVIQEIFGTEPGDLRQVLRDKIDACEGLIQIVGQSYGAEPPTVDTEYGRVSYTQFEFIYARSQKKKTWLLFAGEACSRDTPLERLDLPSDPAHPDPAGYQAERRSLQLGYCTERKKDGHLYHIATSDADLELKVERLRDELGELRRAFKLWQNKVLRAFALGFVLLALIGGSILWFGYDQHREIQGIGKEARHITKEKIRAQLLESVERTRKDALAHAEKAKGWEERERLRQAAEKAYTGSVSRVDELAASFAEIEGTKRSTQVFDEMTRILAEEGVDQALAYVATQRAGILEKVKSRTAATRERNRAELLPLLKSAQLETERNHPAEAEHLFREILELEPNWSEPRNAFAWFLIHRGEGIEPAQGNAKLREAAQICQETLALNPREESPQDWATTQNNLGIVLWDLGRRSGGEEGRKLLADAVAAFRSALEVRTKADLPQAWAQTQNNLGNALWDLGRRSGGEEGRKLLADAVAASRSALEVFTKADLPQAWAQTQNNLGIEFWDLGTRSGGEEGRKLLADAVAASRSALEVFTKADLPQAWAQTQNNLGAVLRDLGTRSGGEEGRKLLADAVAAFRSALEVFTKADLPQAWATTQNNLGAVLRNLGTRSGGEEGRKLLADAVAAFRSALEVFTKADLPQDWASTQNNLGDALRELGRHSGGEEGRKLLTEAVAACRSALEVFTKADLPQGWATTQNNLGNALWDLGTRSGGEEGRKLLTDAVAAFRSALEVRTKADLPQDWAQTQNNLGNALWDLGRRSGGEEGRKLLAEAVAADRSALEVYTKADLPQDWAQTKQNLGQALFYQGLQSEGAKGAELLDQAVAAYRSALEVYTREQSPQQWAATQLTLGAAFATQSRQSESAKATEPLVQAVAAYRNALEVFTREQLPQQWAITQQSLGAALWDLGNQLKGKEGLKRQRESVEAFREVMAYQPSDQSRLMLAQHLGDFAFNLVLNRQFAEAQTRCEAAQRLANELGDEIQKTDRDDLILIQQNLAHALLFQGHYDEALVIYRQYWGKPLNGKTFGQITLEDFAAFDKAGLTHPDLSRMKRALGDLGSKAASP